MNKSELVSMVAKESNLSKDEARRAVDAIIEVISNALKKGDSVSLVGFGTFSVRTRLARMGRNPRTGEIISIRKSYVPGFKSGKALKEAVSGSDTGGGGPGIKEE